MNDSAVLEAAYTLSGSTSGTPITSVAITVTAPARDAVPSATATGTGNFTIGTVTWSPADNPFASGKVYTASVTLTTGLTHEYDGNPKSVTITAKSGIIGMGTATIKYDGKTTTPTGGTYAVTFDVAEGVNYTAANNNWSAGTLTIYFTSIANVETWLSSQPNNTASTAYTVALNVNNLVNTLSGGASSIIGNIGNMNFKYVSLDLSGSTFTNSTIGNSAFFDNNSLVSITIPITLSALIL